MRFHSRDFTVEISQSSTVRFQSIRYRRLTRRIGIQGQHRTRNVEGVLGSSGVEAPLGSEAGQFGLLVGGELLQGADLGG